MQPIPSWFRWLLIVLATLVMCGCRGAFQTGDGSLLLSPPSPTAVEHWQPQSNEALQPFAQAVVHHLHDGAAEVTGSSVVDVNQGELELRLPAVNNEREQLAPIVAIEPPTPEDATPPSQERHLAHAIMLERSVPASNSALPPPEPGAGETSGETDELTTQVGGVTPPVDRPVVLPIPTSTPETTPNTVAPETAERQAAFVEAPMDEGVIVTEGPIVMEGPIVTEGTIVMEGATMVDGPVVMEGSIVHGEPVIEHGGVVMESIVDEHGHVVSNPPPELCLDGSAVFPTPQIKALSRHYPDEYICDGGDAASVAVVGRNQKILGLDPEDTVATFDLADGQAVVEPSNRVCIYAPRFAAVRKVTSIQQNGQHVQAVLAEREVPALTGVSRRIPDQYVQNLAAQRHLGLQPAASFRLRQLGVEASQGLASHTLDKDVSAHENLRVMRYGVHKQSEKARLAEFTAQAVTWSHDKAVQVIRDEVVAQTKKTRQGLGQIHAIGGGPAKLRVIKTASVGDALPGEEVEFTLRFDNVGFQPINNVTVVDNLTTRLEYIPDSQLSSLEAEFIHDENEVDSLTLRWKIVETINPGKGGLIRFRCRVR